MKDRKSLTKSLHTITVVTRVALHLLASKTADYRTSDTDLCRDALRVLGWTDEDNWTRNDPTFAACVAKLKQLRSGGAK